ncbi:MAG: single-stranded DNA-binding protein [Deltaproteobacteria bacterium]|nr:single-stranded DNA-binding protein [Deltaproteobacteria bacterium]
MAGVNKAILLGRLGKDPELRFTQNGTSMCVFTLATSERWGQEERTEWHRIVMYDRLAETANQYLRKGDQVYLEGKIQTRSWNDKAGAKHSMTDIVAGFMQMLGSPKGRGPEAQDQAAAPSEAKAPDFRKDEQAQADRPRPQEPPAGQIQLQFQTPVPAPATQPGPGRQQPPVPSQAAPPQPVRRPPAPPLAGPQDLDPFDGLPDDEPPPDDDMPF